MADTYFTLGSLELRWSPNSYSYSDAAKITQHDLVGGARVFDLMGDNPGAREFGGILSGPDRFKEASALSAMRGTSQMLVAGALATKVLVQQVQLEHGAGQWLTYRVSLLVQDVASGATSTPTAAQAVANAISTANATVSTPDYPAISQPLSTASQGLAGGLSASSVLASLRQAQTACAAVLSQADATIARLGSVSAAGGSPLAAVRALTDLSAAYSTYTTVNPASAQIGRAINLIAGV